MIATAPLPTSAMRAARLWHGNIFGEHEDTRNLRCHAVALRRLATHRTHRQPIIGKHSRWDNRPGRRVLSCLLLDQGVAHPILRHGWLMARSGRFLANAIAAASHARTHPRAWREDIKWMDWSLYDLHFSYRSEAPAKTEVRNLRLVSLCSLQSARRTVLSL